MGLLGCVTLDIAQRDVEDVWENLQSSLIIADGIEPIAMGIIFETYDVIIFLWCEKPENLTKYIINRMRSIKGVTETTVFFINNLNVIQHKDVDEEPGIDGILLIDVECGQDDHVFKEIPNIAPVAEKTFTKFEAFCLHSSNLDLLVGFRGMNIYYLNKLFNKIRLIDGVVDVLVLLFQRFLTLEELAVIREKFPWFL
ncbi:MAG: hypothetical protein ACTSWN_17425 [Promethearchaeota archaeon]